MSRYIGARVDTCCVVDSVWVDTREDASTHVASSVQYASIQDVMRRSMLPGFWQNQFENAVT